MMTTKHLGDAPHPVVASAAREVLNKSDNERSGVLSTAMSFLGLYRDPTVAQVTSRCDWRIADLIAAEHPVSLYLVVPPSDISRTKPLIRLILNQIGRRLTESLDGSDGIARRHRLLLMLDEFPALGPARFLRERAGLHGGLRPARLPHRAIPESDRQGVRRRTTRSSTTATCASPLRPTTSAPRSASRKCWVPRPSCARSATTPGIAWRLGSDI